MDRTIYTSHSKHNYYAKQIVSAYVLKRGFIPLNPFMNWDFYLDSLVGRNLIHEADARLIEMSDEIWQFGEISNGCYYELLLGMKRGMPIKFFTVDGKNNAIDPVDNLDNLVFEQELSSEIDIEEFRQKLKEYFVGTNK